MKTITNYEYNISIHNNDMYLPVKIFKTHNNKYLTNMQIIMIQHKRYSSNSIFLLISNGFIVSAATMEP